MGSFVESNASECIVDLTVGMPVRVASVLDIRTVYMQWIYTRTDPNPEQRPNPNHRAVGLLATALFDGSGRRGCNRDEVTWPDVQRIFRTALCEILGVKAWSKELGKTYPPLDTIITLRLKVKGVESRSYPVHNTSRHYSAVKRTRTYL